MIDNWRDAFIDLGYLVSIIMLIVSLNRLSSPATARVGNFLAMGAIVLATIATLFLEQIDSNYLWILLAIVIGGAIGYVPAMRVQMTAMPQ
nr:NAD(P)(+) transhydrogenase (Re/Si-specific) subunit beta [Chloroflexia bacterium]